MEKIILHDIYTRSNNDVSEYLDVLFITNNGCYDVGVCSISKASSYDLNEFSELKFIAELKEKYGSLEIIDTRITYDNDKYFHFASGFLLVLGYQLNSISENSTNEFWVIEDIDNINITAYIAFLQMDKLDFAV